MNVFDWLLESLTTRPLVFALLPAIIILEHPIYLYLSRPLDLDKKTVQTGDRFSATSEQATKQFTSAFGWAALLLQYVLPALIVAAVSYAVLKFVIQGTMGSVNDSILRATRLGAMGSYFTVLLYLARRVIRHDLTSGGAMLCALTLVLGPVLAGSLSALGIGPPSPNATQTATRADMFGPDAIYFVAGIAPRRIAAAVVEAMTRLWIPESGKAPPPTRIAPLGQVRGITPDIEERLSEEGVYDVTTLAMADPFLLLRNTSFDLRQILNWMDEALLMTTLPEQWQALEKEGITGAVDLAWYHEPATPEPPGPKLPPAVANLPSRPASLSDLAIRAKLEPLMLQDVTERLSEDAQVRLVWFLYQAGSEELPAVGDQRKPKPPDKASSSNVST